MRGEIHSTHHHPLSLSKWISILMGVISLLTVVPSSIRAQVTTAITSSGLNTQVAAPRIIGAETIVDITGGTRPGGGPNIFHSFGRFDVGRTAGVNDIANFLNRGSVDLAGNSLSAGLATANILARVTDPFPSQIYGTIRTTDFGSANLFLMNPAGIIFGPNATLNVGGMAAFTTADYLRLTDGVRFEAAIPSAQDALLSALPVAAFGFLGSNPGAIMVQGSQLSVSPAQSISLAGGNIEIRSGTLDDGSTQPARLSSPNGQINLASAASPGEFLLPNLERGANVDGEAFTSVGTITLAAGSSVDVSGTSMVAIRGGQFVLSVNDAVLTTTASPGAQDTVTLGTGSVISTRTDGADSGSDVQIVASNVQIDGARVQSSTFGEGPGGGISIDAQSMNLSNGAFIRSTAEGLGLGGSVNINVSSVTIDNASVGSFVTPVDFVVDETPGPAVTFNVDDLNIRAGGFVSAESQNIFGEGPPIISGTITINAADTVTVSGTSPGGQRSRIESRTDSGAVGDIVIDTGTLRVTQGARINSEEFLGQAGRILITADSVTVADGAKIRMEGTDIGGGSLEITAPTITIDQAILQTLTVGAGDAASISLLADNVTLSGGQINSQTEQIIGRGGDVSLSVTDALTIKGQFAGNEIDPAGPAGIFTGTLNLGGDAGNVSVTARTVQVSEGARTSSNTFGIGNAGTVEINTNSLRLLTGGQITSSSAVGEFGGVPTGAAGTITVKGLASPAETILIDGAGSGIFTTTEGTGAGGNINLFAQSFAMQNGATLSAATSGTEASAAGGTILVNAIVQDGKIMPTAAQSVTLSNGASISAISTGPANAGNIFINAGNTFFMENSSVTTQATQASGGKISIVAGDMVRLTNSQINTSVADGTGGGGNITIDPNFVILQNSQILAQAFAGQGGNINITTGVFLADASSLVDASSQFGLSGTVTIQSPTSNLSSVWARLQQNYTEAAALLRAACAARVSGQYSSFVQAGRDAVPLEPGGWLLSPLALEGTAVAPPVAQELTGPALASVGLRGFDQNLSWPGLRQMPRRFISILDSACGS